MREGRGRKVTRFYMILWVMQLHHNKIDLGPASLGLRWWGEVFLRLIRNASR